MDIETFEQAEKIVRNLKELENEHSTIQDIFSFGANELTLKTHLGEVKIVDNERMSKIVFMIDNYYWEEDKRLKALLDGI